jgi:F-type H+-transporting ATPase subunit f
MGSRISGWTTAGRRSIDILDGRLTPGHQAIGAAPDAIKMQRVVNFYEKLPRGPAPEVKPTGFFGRYQAKHFGKNPTAKRMFSS